MRKNRNAIGLTSRRKHGCNGEDLAGWGCLGGAALRSIFGGQSQQCGLAQRTAAQALQQPLRAGFQLLVHHFH
jgi:hypothetical protein